MKKRIDIWNQEVKVWEVWGVYCILAAVLNELGVKDKGKEMKRADDWCKVIDFLWWFLLRMSFVSGDICEIRKLMEWWKER